MNKLQILTREILVHTLKISHFMVIFLKRIFGKKTILLVSKQRIHSYSIGPTIQIITLFITLWLGSILAKSLSYNSAIEKKSAEISNLKEANQKFENQVESLNTSLQKINTYFSSNYKPSTPTQNSDQKNIDTKVKDLFGDLSLNSQDKKIADKIANSSLIVDNIKEATSKRVADLNQKLSVAGITLVGNRATIKNDPNDTDKNRNVISLNNKGELSKKQGGPFQDLRKTASSFAGSKIFNFGRNHPTLESEIDHLASLEKFIHFAPLSSPMENYYISSIFGKRTDPIRRTAAKHEGMDFVGKNGAKILSPSAGKVIFAGKFSTYGNALIIDHGYGITTRYGHLSKISVNRGDIVRQSQVIATQGSTGRSTGQHLHYEVRHNNTPINPKKLLQAGQEIFN